MSVEPFHLFRYLDEQAFRFNKRHTTDADHFVQLCSSVAGKRLTWDNLTGRTPWTAKAGEREEALAWLAAILFPWNHQRLI